MSEIHVLSNLAIYGFTTDHAFEEFCRKHGDRINLALIDPPTAKWLRNEYGVSENGNVLVSRAQKHALVVRTCKCGRRVAGNIFFKHVRHCPRLREKATAKAGRFCAASIRHHVFSDSYTGRRVTRCKTQRAGILRTRGPAVWLSKSSLLSLGGTNHIEICLMPFFE